MNIACTSCPAKYAVPDEKVRGRKVRITCKRCGAAIIVDGTELAAASAEVLPRSDRGRQTTILGGLQAPPNSAPGAPVSEPPPPAVEKPAVAESAAAPPAAAPAATPAVARGAQIKPVATNPQAREATAKVATSPEPTWTVAVTDDDHQEMTTKQVVDAYGAKSIDSETYIWRDGMDDWLTPFEIPEIAAALKAKGLTPPSEATGGWHEPGRWDQDAKGQVNFDDVTVAMAAPKAQALLDAVISEGDAVRAADTKAKAKAAAAVTSETLGFSFDNGAPAQPEKVAKEAVKPKEEPLAATAPKEAAKVALDGTKKNAAMKSSPVLDGTLPVKAEPAKVEPAKVEPAKVEPAKAEPAKVEPAKVEPAKVELAKIELVKVAKVTAAIEEDATARPSPPGGMDLFAPAPVTESDEPPAPRARMASIPPEPAAQAALTGARNESSVLFSLDQLTAKPIPKGKAPSRVKSDEEALLLGGPSRGDRAPASVANLGGGALFTQTATMAVPDVMAPPPVSAPSRPAPAPSQAPAATKSESKSGLFIALALLALGGGGVAAFALLKPAAPPVTSPAELNSVTTTPPAQTATPEPATTIAAPSAVESAAPAESAAPSASAAAAVPSASAAAPVATPPPATPVGTTPTTPKPAATPAQPKPAAAAAPPAEKPQAEGPEFDRDAASAALATAAAQAQGECASQEGTHGTGKVAITFSTSGRATNALVSGDFAGSALGGCVARVFRSAKVPAFSGDAVRVTKTVRIP